MHISALFQKVRRRVTVNLRRLPAGLRTFWIRSVYRKAIWYTDRNGITVELLPDDNLPFYFTNRLVFDDIGTINLLRRIIKPGMTVFDVGANWGAFSIFVAQLLKGSGAIHAFEPTTGTYQRLERNVAHLPQLTSQIQINHAAVSSTDGEVVLHTFPPHLSAWNTLGVPTMQIDQNTSIRPTATEIVPAISLDSYASSQGIHKIDLLKIDVEGFEDEVIRGCTRMLAEGSISWVLFEISLAPLNGANKTAQGILRAFEAQGIDIYKIEDSGELTAVGNIDTFAAPYFANYFGVAQGTSLPVTPLGKTSASMAL